MDQAVSPPLKKKGSKPGARTQPAKQAAAVSARAAGKSAPVKIPPIQTLSPEAAEARSRQVLAALMAFAAGDFNARLPAVWSGVDGRIAEAFNQSIANADRVTTEAARLSNTVGKEGRLTQRDRKSTRLNSSHVTTSRMPSSA